MIPFARLKAEIEVIRGGGDPMAFVWDAERNKMIDLWEWMGTEGERLRTDGWSNRNWEWSYRRGRRSEEVFDKACHDVFEVPFGKARSKPAE